jgi:hypothetical protein
MEGLQEPVNGSGSFHAESLSAQSSQISADAQPMADKQDDVAAMGWLSRLWHSLSRRLFRSVTGSSDIIRTVKGDGTAKTRITFRLELRAAGATGPVLNLLLAPILKPVAEDLALKIANEIEAKS